MRLPHGLRWRGQVRVEGTCGHLQRGTFADLRLSGESENQINCKVLRPMGRKRAYVKRTAGFAVCNRGMIMAGELTHQVRGKNCVDRAAMHVIRGSMAMIGLGMNMDQRHGKHP